MIQPALPFTGLMGYQFLSSNFERQINLFSSQPQIEREVNYFEENIVAVQSADDLVGDRRLRHFALDAFGLSEDKDNIFFVKKVLEEGVVDRESFANKLSDPRYRNISKSFGFGLFAGASRFGENFAEGVVGRFKLARFQSAIFEVDADIGKVLASESILDDIVSENKSNDSRWFSVMGHPPVRSVLESALGLPKSMAAIDLDQQLSTFKEKSKDIFGTSDVERFLDADIKEVIARRFLLRQALNVSQTTSSASTALTLLRSSWN